jgi:competence protein ComEC
VAPESLTGASFQMSFAAVVALVAFYETGRRRLSGWLGRGGPGRRVALYAAGVATTTVIASLATGAIGLHHFGRIAAYGLPANMVAVPLTALWIMPWAVVSVALMPFGLESWGLAPMGWGIESMLGVARGVSSWPGAVHPVPAMPLVGLILVALGGLWLCLWRGAWRAWGILGIVAGLATVPLMPRPDVLVSETGKLMAVRLADGRLGLSNSRRERFVGRIWLERSGQKDRSLWPAAGASSGGLLACDGLGCIYRAGGETVALVMDGRALADDCRSATVLIARVPVRGRCPAPRIVIDRFDLWRHGAYALWLSGDGVRVENVSTWQGRRPWSGWPKDRHRLD